MPRIPNLSRSLKPVPVLPELILQFGGGAFLRGFADWMVHRLNGAGKFNGSIVIVQSTASGKSSDINQQGGLYTLITRGIENGKTIDSAEVIGSVSRSIDARSDWAGVLACARDPGIRYVFSNTTEAGIVASKTDQLADRPPESFPSKLTACLLERFNALGGGDDTGWIILPCELIDDNGDTLRRTVLETARRWNLSEAFIAWISRANHFCNTLVDRIVSGFPADDAAAIQEKLGYTDALLNVAEPFHFWAIAAPAGVAEKLPFDKVGLNVVWTNDISSYRKRKVRILNGAHTAMAMVGLLCEKETVREAIEDQDVGTYIRRVIDREILPVPGLPEQDAKQFAKAVIERFANPFLQHRLMSIALNSTSKFKARLLPTIRDYVSRNGRSPELLALALAALIVFYRRRDIRDDADVLSLFAQAWNEFDGSAAGLQKLADNVLGTTAVWGEDLKTIPGLQATVLSHLSTLLQNGCRQSLAKLLAQQIP